MSKKAPAVPAPAIPADLQPIIAEWLDVTKWLAQAKKREMEMRVQLAKHFFPNPSEGVNRVLTADGVEVAINHKINRKIETQVLDAVMNEFPDDSPYRQPDVLITFKPELVMNGFRSLPAELVKVFSQALTETPGAPELEIAPAEVAEVEHINSHPDFPAATRIINRDIGNEIHGGNGTATLVRKNAYKAKSKAKPKSVKSKARK